MWLKILINFLSIVLASLTVYFFYELRLKKFSEKINEGKRIIEELSLFLYKMSKIQYVFEQEGHSFSEKRLLLEYYIKPIYEDLLETLKSRKAAAKYGFKQDIGELPPDANIRPQNFSDAENITIKHIAQVLDDLNNKNYEEVISYFFRKNPNKYHLPGKFWKIWVQKNNKKYYNYIVDELENHKVRMGINE